MRENKLDGILFVWPRLVGAQELALGQAGIVGLVRIAYVVLSMLNVDCLTEILKVKCVSEFCR